MTAISEDNRAAMDAASIWCVWITPDDRILGPSVLRGTVARIGFAIKNIDGGWREVSLLHAHIHSEQMQLC